MCDEVTAPSAGARPGFGGYAAGPARLSPAVRETIEAIVRAVGAGDDILIDRLLTRFTQLADFHALIHLHTRLHTTQQATTGLRPNTTLPLTPGSRSPLRGTGYAGVLGQ
ncbi:hypothetical protein ACFWC9_10770 [Streptomyces goshikiensis]|uniref:hypothetical protein n=1 Tax=Streptomyces goshikiensis TaxID=1942 RepID=UPI00369EEB8E